MTTDPWIPQHVQRARDGKLSCQTARVEKRPFRLVADTGNPRRCYVIDPNNGQVVGGMQTNGYTFAELCIFRDGCHAIAHRAGDNYKAEVIDFRDMQAFDQGTLISWTKFRATGKFHEH